MSIPNTNPIDFSDLNVEFGRSSTAQISLSSAINGAYSSDNTINRNTLSGQNIFAASINSNNYALTLFKGYNETEPMYWIYSIINNTGLTYSVDVDLGATNILGVSIPGGGNELAGEDSTGITTTSNLYLTISGQEDQTVIIDVTDPDTGSVLYSASTLTPLSSLDLGIMYRYQRFNLQVTIS